MNDIVREEELKSFDLSIIRFTNTQIDIFFDEVINAIREVLKVKERTKER